VVLCQPLGDEAMCAHRALRALAERLSEEGFHVLRFDYHGTGDSAGLTEESERLAAWQGSVREAMRGLSALSGEGTIDLVGLRFGATLAVLAAASGVGVGEVVLWAPCVSGRAYAREVRAVRRMADHDAGLAPSRGAAGESDDRGELFTDETLTELSRVDLLAGATTGLHHVLLLSRDDAPGAEGALARHLEQLGVEVKSAVDAEYSRMMCDAQDSVVPWATIEAITRHLVGAVLVSSAAPSNVAETSALRGVLVTRVGAHGELVREETLRFGLRGRLFGVLSESAAEPALPPRPAIVFLNVGANHHVGPHRLSVSMSREWAARGHAGFRFDLAGMGESDLGAGMAAEALYAEASLTDLAEALAALAGLRGIHRFILVGLCSGATLAFRATLTHPQVAAQILINTQTFTMKAASARAPGPLNTFHSTRYYVEALRRRGVWVRALRGRLDHRGIARTLVRRLAARLGDGWARLAARLRGREAPRSEPLRSLLALSARGVQTLLVFSATDGGLDRIEEELGAGIRRGRGAEGLHVELIEGADHTFSSARSRRALMGVLAAFLEEAFP